MKHYAILTVIFFCFLFVLQMKAQESMKINSDSVSPAFATLQTKLSLCRILAERLGARVYLDDSYHEGCLFVLAHSVR